MTNIKLANAEYQQAINEVGYRFTNWKNFSKPFLRNYLNHLVKTALGGWAVLENEGGGDGFESIGLKQNSTPSSVIENGNVKVLQGPGLLFSTTPIGLVNIRLTSPTIDGHWDETNIVLREGLDPAQIVTNQEVMIFIDDCVIQLLNASKNWYKSGKFEPDLAIALV